MNVFLILAASKTRRYKDTADDRALYRKYYCTERSRIMKKKVRILSVLLALTLVLGLAACNGDQSTPSPGPPANGNGAAEAPTGDGQPPAQAEILQRVVSVFNTLDNDYFIAWDNGARQAAAALGLEYEAITTEGDGTRELQGIESAIAAGVRMFAVVPIGMQSVPMITQLASEHDAFMSITWDIPEWFTPMDAGDGFTVYLAPDMEMMMYSISTALFEYLGGSGTVVHVTGLPGTTGDIMQTRGVDRAAANFPDITLVGRLPGNYNRVDSQRVMENLLIAYPEFDAVIGNNDATAIGIIAAIEAAGRPMVPVIGMDGAKEALLLIEEGVMWGTASAFPEWQGGYAVVRAYDAAHGFEPLPTERMMNTGSLLVTQENVAAVMQAMYGTDTLPFDWTLMSRVRNPDAWDPQNLVSPIDVTQMWDEATRPSGYELPQELLDAIAGGELEKVTRLYADQFRRSILD